MTGLELYSTCLWHLKKQVILFLKFVDILFRFRLAKNTHRLIDRQTDRQTDKRTH